jgi:hypothetical protein
MEMLYCLLILKLLASLVDLFSNLLRAINFGDLLLQLFDLLS